MSFRSRFVLNTPLEKWFPGHMISGMREMQKRLSQVDCVIEVHDARIPLSGRNREFSEGMGVIKPHLLLLNKKDLADRRYDDAVQEALKSKGVNKVLWTNLSGKCTLKESNFESVLPSIIKLVTNSDRYNRADSTDITAMVTGIPNVGKSCLINRLRQNIMRKTGDPAAVGASAGVTRHVQKVKVYESPKVYILDTPGILEPKVKNVEQYMKLALISCLKDEVIGIQAIADYALYWMNKNREEKYVKYFNLENPSDSIIEVLLQICTRKRLTQSYSDPVTRKQLPRPNLEAAAGVFVKAFRTGCFGRFVLDIDVLKTHHAQVNFDRQSLTLPFANE